MKPGDRLGPYEVVALLGSGGMGEVYQARDTRLGRTVAIKVLPPGASADPARRLRFEQEARAVSALNHPHICVLHDIGREGDTDFLVMEYLDGPTLAERLRKGALPLPQVLEIGAQVADALATAHRHGIVHRDLKPANIMLTKAGTKLLDFGLAKLKAPPLAAGVGLSALSTQAPATTPGAVMGTVPYMAPEQLEGKDTDARTDLFAFGCVLYEMLTARRAFGGDSEASVISAIMSGEPTPLSTLQPLTPPALDRLVRRCLAKDPDDRWESARDVAEELRGISADSGTRTSAPAVRPRRWRWLLPVAAAVVLLTIAGVWYFLPRRPPLTDRDWVVLADFQNTTDDPSLSIALEQLLSSQLGQSPFMNVFPESRIRDRTSGTLVLMQRQPTDALTPDVARDVCQREALKATIGGSIASVGSSYAVTVTATNCASGEAIAIEQARAATKEQILDALTTAASGIRSRLGESLASIEKYSKPARATASNFEALKLYGQATTFWNNGQFKEAIPLNERAVELDPNFALAWSRLGNHLTVLGRDPARAKAAWTRAFELRDRVTEPERYEIEGAYYQHVTQDLDKAIQTCELWTATYPRDSTAHNQLGSIFLSRGDLERAVIEYRDAVRLNPTAGTVNNLAVAQFYGNHVDEAAQTIRSAFARNIGVANPGIHRLLYCIAYLRNDQAAMQREVEWSRGGTWELTIPGLQVGLATCGGRLKESRELSDRYNDIVARGRAPAATGTSQAARWVPSAPPGDVADDAFTFAMVGDPKRAVALAESVTDVPSTWRRCLLAYAMAGDERGVNRLLPRFASAPPENVWPIDIVPTTALVHAILLTRQGKANEALDALKAASLYERANRFQMLPQYWRAYALLGAKRPAEAIAEFQKVIALRTINITSLAWPLAHVGLARAYAAAGDPAASRKAYEDFFALWKDADRDIPILIEANKEYAALK